MTLATGKLLRRASGWCTTVAMVAAFIPLSACLDGPAGGGSGAPGARAVDASSLPDLVLTEDLRIGSATSPDSGFTQIGGVRIARDGRIVVLERQAPEIRVYRPDGTLLNTIGGEGEGPGEFRWPLNLGLRRDTVWVSDANQERLTLFDLEGTVLETVPWGNTQVRVNGGSLRVIPDRPLGNGRFGGGLWYPHPGGTRVDSVTVPAPVFDATGAVVDTVGTLFLEPEPEGIVVRNMGLFAPMPVRSWPLRFPVGDDTVGVERPAPRSGDPAIFTVTRWTAAGDTVSRTRFRYRPLPYELEHLVTALITSSFSVERAAVEAALREEGRVLPPFHAPVARHEVGADGSIWLQREEVDRDTLRWLVLRPDGSPRGHVRLPRDRRPRAVSGDAVWLVENDALDVPWLVRMRVEG